MYTNLAMRDQDLGFGALSYSPSMPTGLTITRTGDAAPGIVPALDLDELSIDASAFPWYKAKLGLREPPELPNRGNPNWRVRRVVSQLSL